MNFCSESKSGSVSLAVAGPAVTLNFDLKFPSLSAFLSVFGVKWINSNSPDCVGADRNERLPFELLRKGSNVICSGPVSPDPWQYCPLVHCNAYERFFLERTE